ncbi:MAG TPA: hypothetical protein VG929_09675 [Actinomycetota bacterium]|nr:hypothetical protein [Actinomycetota bacterium]
MTTTHPIAATFDTTCNNDQSQPAETSWQKALSATLETRMSFSPEEGSYGIHADVPAECAHSFSQVLRVPEDLDHTERRAVLKRADDDRHGLAGNEGFGQLLVAPRVVALVDEKDTPVA